MIVEKLLNLENCNICKDVQHKVLGYGDLESASIMFVGQNPGYKEKKFRGRIEIGPFQAMEGTRQGSSIILKKLLDDLEIPEYKLYVTNVVKCATFRNRKPDQEIINNCFPFLFNEIERCKNLKRIVCLGQVSSNLFKLSFGECIDFGRFMVGSFWHPNYVLRKQTRYDEWKLSFKQFLKGVF